MLRAVLRVLGAVLSVLILAAAVLAWFLFRPMPLPGGQAFDFDIARGASARQASAQLAAAGLGYWPPLLEATVRATGKAARIKAGSYRLEQPLSVWELSELLTAGGNAWADLTIVEGWNLTRLREALDAHPHLAHDTRGLSEAQLLEKLGVNFPSAEGLFSADTFAFARGSSDLELLQRAAAHLQRGLDAAWQTRAADLPLRTPYEALTLASVVEKETGRAADRPLVASVFINRLRLGMPLQSDPTVIYGMGSRYDGKLFRADLQRDTPYNSYTRRGLPPGPIAAPGAAALAAVLNPPATNYLYFVARGDGSSEFSRTLDEHNRAVARYIKAARK